TKSAQEATTNVVTSGCASAPTPGCTSKIREQCHRHQVNGPKHRRREGDGQVRIPDRRAGSAPGQVVGEIDAAAEPVEAESDQLGAPTHCASVRGREYF